MPLDGSTVSTWFSIVCSALAGGYFRYRAMKWALNIPNGDTRLLCINHNMHLMLFSSLRTARTAILLSVPANANMLPLRPKMKNAALIFKCHPGPYFFSYGRQIRTGVLCYRLPFIFSANTRPCEK